MQWFIVVLHVCMCSWFGPTVGWSQRMNIEYIYMGQRSFSLFGSCPLSPALMCFCSIYDLPDFYCRHSIRLELHVVYLDSPPLHSRHLTNIDRQIIAELVQNSETMFKTHFRLFLVLCLSEFARSNDIIKIQEFVKVDMVIV